MNHVTRSLRSALVAVAALLLVTPLTSTAAQELPPPQPIQLDCATDASAQVLNSTPVGDGSETLVLARVLFAPGGSLGEHNHPGTLAVVVESGTLGFTLIDDAEMVITRAATADTEATEEPVVPGEELVLDPGDAFIDMNMVHSVTNLDDGQTTVMFAGLIETGEPLTACVDDATPAS